MSSNVDPSFFREGFVSTHYGMPVYDKNGMLIGHMVEQVQEHDDIFSAAPYSYERTITPEAFLSSANIPVSPTNLSLPDQALKKKKRAPNKPYQEQLQFGLHQLAISAEELAAIRRSFNPNSPNSVFKRPGGKQDTGNKRRIRITNSERERLDAYRVSKGGAATKVVKSKWKHLMGGEKMRAAEDRFNDVVLKCSGSVTGFVAEA